MLIYDGDCAFCTSSAAWIQRRMSPGYPVVAWQSLDTLEPYRLSLQDVQEAAWWIDVQGHAHRGADAVARSLLVARRPWWMVGRLLLVPPISWLARLVYPVIARNRHRLPGSTDACAIR